MSEALFPRLVTAEQAKTHLRLNHNQDDDEIEMLVEQASAIVLNYIKQYPRSMYQALPEWSVDSPVLGFAAPWAWVVSAQPPYWWPSTKISFQQLPPYRVPDWVDSEGQPENVPPDIARATLLVIGALFNDREGEKSPISPAVEILLERHRDPAIA